ncbi:MAG: NAD(P)/FAD-dependent oxidoreductase [Microthrixaceae bacterium]
MDTDALDVIVVGAGLAGLSAARLLRQSGLSVAVFESSDGVGGRVRTDLVDGCRLDRGFQVILTAYPELKRQFDVEGLDLRSFDPGAMVRVGDEFCVLGDPLRRPGTLPSTLRAPVGGIADKLRMLRYRRSITSRSVPEVLRAPDGPTLERLRSFGFSDRMIDSFFRPLAGGILLDPSLATSHRMFDTVFRTLAVGDAAVPALGMGEIPNQLADQVGRDVIRLGTRVAAVEPGAVTLDDGSVVQADSVVVATEGPVASRLLGLPEVHGRAAGCVWFRAATPPTDSLAIILDGNGTGPALNVAVMTNIAPEYSNDGSAVIAAACPGVANSELAGPVREQLRVWWGRQVDRWEHLRTDVIEHGQPEQDPPFDPKGKVALGDGLYVCGDHRDTASTQGAMFSGRRCAEAVLASRR